MPIPRPDELDAAIQATALPASAGGGLIVWSRAETLAGSTETARLWSLGASHEVRGVRVTGPALLPCLEGAAGRCSASLQAWRAIVPFARALVRRGGVRPRIDATGDLPRATWCAAPDASERRVLVSILSAMPAIGLAAWSDVREGPDAGWERFRAVLDAVVDAIVRGSPAERRYAAGSFEGELEAALSSGDGMLKLGARPIVRRTLDQWDRAARAAQRPRVKLVLRLRLPDSGRAFPLEFLARVQDGDEAWLVPAGAVFSGAPEARLAADDLAPLREALREALHKAGQEVLPIEVSLASEAPSGAVLDAAETWSLATRDRISLERQGVRVELPEALDGLERSFPRARLRLLRADGASPEEPSLANRYTASWEVVTGDRALSASTLREAARSAPIARAGDGWMPITAEAGERLARVAEREATDWTGPQALSAALAGEVRLAGDLADAQVVAEPGLLALIAELGREAAEQEPSPSLKATLRAYQRRGVSWMFHRTKLGLGALLADDMGLGKTVQLIALLLRLRDANASGGPTLLVCPASLVGNWERELARFAPDLRVVRHHGDERRRDAASIGAAAGAHDVVVTTYGLVRRDAKVMGELAWGTVVCDEAQNLKNPQAAQARAVRSLVARRRIALSGTPVENRLSELWSLMEFLNPGLLGPLERFRRELALPIERDRDARAVRWLQAATRPFLLRRLKTDPDVAPELPEKEVIRVFCSLTEEQARLYKQAVDESLGAIEGAEGIERQGRVLKLLTRLKQVCNHPAQVEDVPGELSGRSGKLERAAEMLEEIVDSGDRALVFTQYVRMGELLVHHLGARLGREVPIFHGGLDLEARDRMVRRFQEAPDGPPVMVLSLKAGGVGLNLTRANHVVHFDRWWNPAVEDQATDRVHRIGQTRRVQVHHLVTMGTLEERIDRMLEEKRQLADAVVSGGEAWLSRLSTDELRALVSLGSDAAVENVESWESAE